MRSSLTTKESSGAQLLRNKVGEENAQILRNKEGEEIIHHEGTKTKE